MSFSLAYLQNSAVIPSTPAALLFLSFLSVIPLPPLLQWSHRFVLLMDFYRSVDSNVLTINSKFSLSKQSRVGGLDCCRHFMVWFPNFCAHYYQILTTVLNHIHQAYFSHKVTNSNSRPLQLLSMMTILIRLPSAYNSQMITMIHVHLCGNYYSLMSKMVTIALQDYYSQMLIMVTVAVHEHLKLTIVTGTSLQKKSS